MMRPKIAYMIEVVFFGSLALAAPRLARRTHRQMSRVFHLRYGERKVRATIWMFRVIAIGGAVLGVLAILGILH